MKNTNLSKNNIYITLPIPFGMQYLIFLMTILCVTSILLTNDKYVLGQTHNIDNNTATSNINKMVTNSLNLSDPIYQALSATFLATKNISSNPSIITEDYAIEHAIMKNVGNVTNNMTFTNTHLSDGLIQSKSKGVITTGDGQTIGWISTDLGTMNSKGELFHGIILFNSTNSPSLLYLNNATGIYKVTPDIQRTIWLVK
jgi:hypothetical protein